MRIIKEVTAGDNFTIGQADSRGVDHLYSDDADDWYEQRHREDQMTTEDYMYDSLYSIIEKNPGLSGDELFSLAMRDGIFGGKTKEDVFDVADTMIAEGDVFLDVEEDQWFTTAHGGNR